MLIGMAGRGRDVFEYEVEKVNVDKAIDLGGEGHGAIVRSAPQAEVVVLGSKWLLGTLMWIIILTFQDQHRAHWPRCSLDNNFVEANDLGRETCSSNRCRWWHCISKTKQQTESNLQVTVVVEKKESDETQEELVFPPKSVQIDDEKVTEDENLETQMEIENGAGAALTLHTFSLWRRPLLEHRIRRKKVHNQPWLVQFFYSREKNIRWHVLIKLLLDLWHFFWSCHSELFDLPICLYDIHFRES